MTMHGPCERCGDGGADQTLHRQVDGATDLMVCSRCLGLEPPVRGCARCGQLNMLQVTRVEIADVDVEVRLCVRCRRLAAAENLDAARRKEAKGL